MEWDRARGLAAFIFVVALAAATLAAAFAASAQAASALRLGRCPASVRPEPDLFGDEPGPDHSRCGRLAVPLDRSGATPGTVGLRVRVLAPRRAAGATILALAGGPGQAAVPLLDGFAQTLGDALDRRRLVAFDQRGTGGSGRLRCPSLRRARGLRSIGPAVAACAERLGPRRAHYTTAASVQDIEAVRVAVGAPRLILYGTSYGTKVALDYAATYPERVESLVLDSVVPQAGNDAFQRPTLHAVPRVLGALCAGGRCPFTRDPGADVATLVQRIARDGRIRARFFDRRGRGHDVGIDRSMLLDALLAGDVDPLLRAAFPAAARAAVEGDAAPLARLLGASGGGGGEEESAGDALYVATVCEDGRVPWPDGTPVEARGGATATALAAVPPAELAPFDAGTLTGSGLLLLCRTWPESPIPQPVGPLPDVPALLLAGGEDLRTPVEDAQAVAALLPRARLVVVPQTGHSTLGSDFGRCSERALRAFLTGGAVRDCRTPRRRLFQPLPLAPTSLGSLRAAPGLPPRVGRTVSAVLATVGDIDQESSIRLFSALMSGNLGDAPPPAWGGLRGGFAALSGRGETSLVVRDYSYVPGVVLDGGEIQERNGQIHVAYRVSGRAAANGRVRLSNQGMLTGRLGGRRVELRVGRPAGGGGRGRSAVAALAAPRDGALPALRDPRLLKPARLAELRGTAATPLPALRSPVPALFAR